MPGNATAWACLGLGVVIMYLTLMFVTRFLKSDANAKPGNLAKFLAIFLSGTVVGFLTAQLGAGAKEFAWYAIGLVVGFAAYLVFYFINTGIIVTRAPGRHS
jgi:hypothetical protein